MLLFTFNIPVSYTHLDVYKRQVATRIKEHFPELTVYTSFNPPRWLCRAGDFRSIEEADAMMRQLRATGAVSYTHLVVLEIWKGHSRAALLSI